MNKLEQLEKMFRPQFVWDSEGLKVLQTNEEYEGSKDLARLIFVGVAEMHGFDPASVQEYLDMEYDSYRNKISRFRQMYKEVLFLENRGLKPNTQVLSKFRNKLGLVTNAIRYNYNMRFVKLEEWLNYED